MAENRVPGELSAWLSREELEARRAAAAQVWHSAAELVAEARASRAHAQELRRQLEARRLRAARDLGSAAQGGAGQHAAGGATALGAPAGRETPADRDPGDPGAVAGGGVAELPVGLRQGT